MKKLILPSILVCGLAITGCANSGATYKPVNDGQRSAAYSSDLQACQQLAAERGYLNDDVKTDALIGAGIGALAGLADTDVNDTEGAIAGAVVGAIAGGGARMNKTRDERRQIVVRCMQGRGHSVVG